MAGGYVWRVLGSRQGEESWCQNNPLSQRRGVSEAEELQTLGRSSGEQDLSPRGRGKYKEATSNPKQNQNKKPENSVLD